MVRWYASRRAAVRVIYTRMHGDWPSQQNSPSRGHSPRRAPADRPARRFWTIRLRCGWSAPGFARDMERAMHKVARDFRAFMAARSRYAEDRLAEAVANGSDAVRGSRRGPRHLCLSQSVSRAARLRGGLSRHAGVEARDAATRPALRCPTSLTFVPLDFEHKTLAEGLGRGGIRCGAARRSSAGWAWCPISRSRPFAPRWTTIAQTARRHRRELRLRVCAGDAEPASGRTAFDALAGRVAAAGEPFQLFFTPETMEAELRRAGFMRIEQIGFRRPQRALLSRPRRRAASSRGASLGMLVTAWV